MLKIDTHQHFWNLEQEAYPWLTADFGPLFRTYTPDELEPQLHDNGIDGTVIVQAADSHEDTEAMLRIAEARDFVVGVVAWVDLLDPQATSDRLDELSRNHYFCGIRHLIHDNPDPDWILQDAVIESLGILAERGVPFDYISVNDALLNNLLRLIDRVPELNIVVDHAAKPPIKDKGWQPWADLMARAAESPGVFCKISGLNTAADFETWTGEDLKPFIDHCREAFGARRLMFGSDWPVAVLAGDYTKVVRETERATADWAQADLKALWSGAAIEFYGLETR